VTCDVFVSYARRDNRAPINHQGFVSRLIELVKIGSEQKYGQDIEWFWDEDLASGTQWKDEIYERLAACRVFIAIVSPSWTNSQWAGREWDAVWKRVKEDRALGNQTRIIPVSFSLDKGAIATLPEQVRSLQFRRRFHSVMPDGELLRQADGLADDVVRILILLDRIEKERQVEDS
jgi:hypothetical protein